MEPGALVVKHMRWAWDADQVGLVLMSRAKSPCTDAIALVMWVKAGGEVVLDWHFPNMLLAVTDDALQAIAARREIRG